jgi:hypothetical protein
VAKKEQGGKIKFMFERASDEAKEIIKKFNYKNKEIRKLVS